MNTEPLFDADDAALGDYPGRRHADAADTEHAAAQSVLPRARQAAYAEYLKAGADGLTDYELNRILHPSTRTVSAGTRRKELMLGGYPIRDSGRRRATDTGHQAIVWILDP